MPETNEKKSYLTDLYKKVFSSKYNNNTLYTKNTDESGKEILRKYTLSFDNSPENPRDAFEPIGEMVFEKMRNWSLGDKQISDFEEYFATELENERRYKADAKFTVTIPDVETAKKNKILNNLYIRSDAQNNEHFDKVFFENEIEAFLSDLKSKGEFIDEDIDITCGIPLDSKNKLTDKLEIEVHIPEKEYESSVENPLQFFIRELSEYLSERNLFWDDEYKKSTNFDGLSKEELFKKWNEKNIVSIPISVYEHSGITIHEGHENSLPDYGIIFIKKDNTEVLDYLKDHTPEEAAEWAKGILSAEISLYDDYLRGEVYGITQEVYNEKERRWEIEESTWGVYLNHSEKLGWSQQIADTFNEYMSTTTEKAITKEEGEAFVNTPLEKILSFFFEDAKALLPEYENKPFMAYKTQLLLWKNTNKSDWAKEVNSYVEKNCHNRKELNFLLFDKMDMEVDPGNIYSIALNVLPEEDISTHYGDLYLASSPVADKLIEKLDKSTNGIKTGMITTFIDQVTGRKSYDLPHCALGKYIQDDRREMEEEKANIISRINQKKDSPSHKREKKEPEIER